MTIPSDVKVLEDWFQMDSHGLDSLSVLLKYFFDFVVLSWIAQVLSSGKESVILRVGIDSDSWVLVNSLDGESLVDVGHKVSVSEETLSILGGVLVSKGLKLILCEGEIHARENRFELCSGDSTLPQLVKVSEELFDSDSLHDNCSPESVLHI
jgi:hypothetical protein